MPSATSPAVPESAKPASVARALERAGLGAARAVADRPRSCYFTTGQAREPGFLLMLPTRFGDRQRHDVRGHEWTRLNGATTFFGHNDRITHGDSRNAPSAEFLGHEEGVPAELGGVSQNTRISQLRIVRHGPYRRKGTPRVDESGGRLAEELLVLRKIDIHLYPLSAPVVALDDASSAP